MKPTDPITFGKHKGTALRDIPRDYLLWLATQEGFKDKNPSLYAYIKTGEDLADPARPAADAELERVEGELLGLSPQGFRGWWVVAYGRLKVDGPTIYIAQLRCAISSWEACANVFYAKQQAERVLKPASDEPPDF